MATCVEDPDIPDCFIHRHLIRLANLIAKIVKNEDAICLDSPQFGHHRPRTWLPDHSSEPN